MNNVLQNNSMDVNFQLVPKAFLTYNESGYTLNVELPGVEKNDVNIDIEPSLLSLNAFRVDLINGKVEWNRKFRFNKAVDASQVKGSMKNGILTLQLPFAESAKKCRISIE